MFRVESILDTPMTGEPLLYGLGQTFGRVLADKAQPHPGKACGAVKKSKGSLH